MNADMDGHRLLNAMKPECIVTNKPAARVELLGDLHCFPIAIVDGLAALDARAVLRGEVELINLFAELGGVANRAIVHVWQPGHAGDGGGIVGLQRRTKFRDRACRELQRKFFDPQFMVSANTTDTRKVSWGKFPTCVI